MRYVKKYLTFSMVLLIYVMAMAIVLQQFYAYYKAYLLLGKLVSHSTVEVSFVEDTEEE